MRFRFSLKWLLLIVFGAAVGLAIYQRPPKRLEDLRHVEITKVGTPGSVYQFRFQPKVNQRTIREVLSLLPVGGQIRFFDHKVTISDPGVYVSMRRVSEDEFYVYGGNHGWTSNWFSLSSKEAAAYLWICHDDNLSHAEQKDWPWSDMGLSLKPGSIPKLGPPGNSTYESHVRALIGGPSSQ